MNQFIEIPSYNLKPGMRDEFHRLFLEEPLPLLKRWKVDIVAHGPSLHEENSYYMIHRFDTLARRAEVEAAYYVSDDWRLVPRAAILALIENRFTRISSLRWMRSQCRDCESKIILASDQALILCRAGRLAHQPVNGGLRNGLIHQKSELSHIIYNFIRVNPISVRLPCAICSYSRG